MRPGRRVVGLGGMGGPLVVAGIDQGQELLGIDRLELLEAGDLHLALAILQNLEALPLVEQILDSAAVDLEECDVHGRIVEAAGRCCSVRSSTSSIGLGRLLQQKVQIFRHHGLDAAHGKGLPGAGLAVRKDRGPPPATGTDEVDEGHGTMAVDLLRRRRLVECMVKREGRVIEVLGDAVHPQLGAVHPNGRMEARDGRFRTQMQILGASASAMDGGSPRGRAASRCSSRHRRTMPMKSTSPGLPAAMLRFSSAARSIFRAFMVRRRSSRSASIRSMRRHV